VLLVKIFLNIWAATNFKFGPVFGDVGGGKIKRVNMAQYYKDPLENIW